MWVDWRFLEPDHLYSHSTETRACELHVSELNDLVIVNHKAMSKEQGCRYQGSELYASAI